MDYQSSTVFDEKATLVDVPRTLGALYPVTPADTGRYDVAKKVKRQPVKILAGNQPSSSSSVNVSFLLPTMWPHTQHIPDSLPPHWSEWVHPEGKVYFYCQDGLRTVTDSYLHKSDVSEKIDVWRDEIQRLAKLKGIACGQNVELFMQISGDDCSYYFAEATSRTLFWLDDYETSDLGLLPAVSPSHLKLVLEAQWWAHVENFSMHFGGLDKKVIDDLILIFIHGRADTLTSTQSTFPYDASACERYLSLLTSSRDQIHEGYIVTVVARLWGVIVYNRYETHFGQEQSRLSRGTSIIESDDSNEITWAKKAISCLTLKTSDSYQSQLDSLFVDDLAYGYKWASFMSSCLKGWQQSIVASFGLLLLHVFFFLLPLSPILAIVSAVSSSISILTAILLIHRHEELNDDDACVAHEYLGAVLSPRFKFQHVAFAYSLPRASFLWSLLAFFSQWVFLVAQWTVYPRVTYFILAGLFAGFAAFQWTTSRVASFSIPSLSFWKSQKDEASMV